MRALCIRGRGPGSSNAVQNSGGLHSGHGRAVAECKSLSNFNVAASHIIDCMIDVASAADECSANSRVITTMQASLNGVSVGPAAKLL